MNNVILMGRLTRDPDMRYLPNSNRAVTRFTLAVDKNLSREKRQEMESRNQPTADFISVVAWDKLGENIDKFTGKGLRVIVQGRIQTGSYEKDGQRVYTTDIVASNVEFIDWKDSNQQNSSASGRSLDTFTPPIDDDFEYGADFDPTEDSRIPF